MSLALVGTREQAMEYLEGYAIERKAELESGRTTAGLVKSYLLETVPPGMATPDLQPAFQQVGARLDHIEDDLYKIWDSKERRYIGLLEHLLSRHPVIYSNERTAVIDPWCQNLVNINPSLDRLWLSGITFERLWEKVVQINPGRRFGRLAFEHQSIFEIDADDIEREDADNEATSDEIMPEKDETIRERRATRFTVIDRIEVLKERLPQLQQIYHPLFSISQLRFPAAGKGGHDFYFNGKVTNRSDSFADHRAHLVLSALTRHLTARRAIASSPTN